MANDDAIFKYDAFLSSIGGTPSRFAADLYNALRSNEVNAIRDDDEELQTEYGLREAIENSRTLVVVLCEDYASSAWRLDVLTKIVDCTHNREQRVLPIFYNVEPSDVREQRNFYEKAMVELQEIFGQDTVDVWKSTLSSVVYFDGIHCRHSMNEFMIIKVIVAECLFPQVDSSSHRVMENHDGAFMYDVFISASMKNTQFANGLYCTLRRRGISTFMYKEQKRGDRIRQTLKEVIENSRVSIIVFCIDYAESIWCLEVLATIINSHDNRGQLVLPVFYFGKPSDVLHHRNRFEAAMIRHERTFGQDSERVRTWRSALSRVISFNQLRYGRYWDSEPITDWDYGLDIVDRNDEPDIGWSFGVDSGWDYDHDIIDIIAEDTAELLLHHMMVNCDATFMYDVCLIFIEESGTVSLENCLYDALHQERIKTYIFKKDRRSVRTRYALTDAIKSSKMSIVVLSKYRRPIGGFPIWFLDALVTIIICHDKKGQLVLPIFYDIEQRVWSNFAALTIERYERCNQFSGRVSAWKSALSTVSGFERIYSSHYRSEGGIVLEVVRRIHELLHMDVEGLDRHRIVLNHDVLLSCNFEYKTDKFVRYLDNALCEDGVKTYTIYGIQGNVWSDEISPYPQEAIEQSRMSIVVLNEQSIHSMLHLDVLAKIMNCKDNMGQQVLIIFYKLDPSYIRNQVDLLVAERFRRSPETVRAWRLALSNVWSQDILHFTSTDYDNEHQLIEDIVAYAKDRLYPPPPPPESQFFF